LIGRTLVHYRILEKIGAGNMGEVYRAHDSKLEREVAIKVLPPESAPDQDSRRRFEREARAIAALKHPNIVTIHSVEEADGLHFITMELVEGQILSELLPVDGLSVEDFFELAIPLTEAMSCAHAQGITHRDLKPANIMVDREGRLKVLDFGLAKQWIPQAKNLDDTVPADAPLTEVGGILGTVPYMSPEQVTGGEVGGRSDIFSLGIIFHELLSGTRPFGGEYSIEIMHNIVNAEAPHLSFLPDALIKIIDRCLRKEPEERFAGADELCRALRDQVGKAEPVAASSAARIAFDQEEWEGAYRLLRSTQEQRELHPDELEMISTCASWIGEFDEWRLCLEKAFASYSKAERNIDAARVALVLVGIHIEKNAGNVAGGWLKRAERLLRDEPDCVEHGNLLRRQTVAALGISDFARALELNRMCRELADRFQDSDLQAEALHDRGRILIARGDVEEGRGCVDEAMVSAVSGEVNPQTMGNLYCRTMVVCRSLADFKSVREWSEEAWRWNETQEGTGYSGVCQIHSAETMRHLGLWEKAEQAVRSACIEFAKSGLDINASEAFNELGELALRKGEYREAEQAFQRAHEFGHDPVPGLPLLRLAQGKGEAAQRIIERALSEGTEDRLGRAKILTGAITIALANGERSLAERATGELRDIADDFDCQCFKAYALMGQGGLEGERGDYDSATKTLREAWSTFNELGFLYDAARARTLLATAYLEVGNEDDARMQLGAACKTFGELGAEPDLAHASELMKKLN
jgi:serine/threonine protein kinase